MNKNCILTLLLLFMATLNFHYSQCTNNTTMCSAISTLNDTLCSPNNNIDINIIGGSLGPGSEWELYTDSCGGTLVSTTSSTVFSNIPVNSSTTFYCKADSCGINSCVSLDIYVFDLSIDPNSLSIDNDTLCVAGNVNFTINGGYLGSLANWELFKDSCSGSPISMSSSNVVSNVFVDSTSSYFVKANGYCNTTNCSSVDFFLADSSIGPLSLTISNDTSCLADTVNLLRSGGFLGTNATWELLENNCNGTPIATSINGDFLNIPTSITTNYFLRANGYCNTTSCESASFLLADSSQIPNGIISTDSIICDNGTFTLSLDNGFLGTSAQWIWYNDSCNGNIIGYGSTLSYSQDSTSAYFLKAEGLCNNTGCRNITISNSNEYIELDSIVMDSIYNSSTNSWNVPDSVCPQSTVTLLAKFSGNIPFGHPITWYENYCGSSIIGYGDSILVYPDSTTTYFARFDGDCGGVLCKSITVKTKNGSLAPTGITASQNNFCTDDSTTLNIVGGLLGDGAEWSWYKGSCSSNSIGTGSSIIVTPASTTSYFANAIGGVCGATSCTEILINTYDLNMYHSPLNPTCETTTIILEGGFPSGGTYSGIGITDTLFDPNIAGVGTHPITYTYNDGNNCTKSVITTIDVFQLNPDPLLFSASSFEICNGNSTVLSIDTNSILIPGSKWVWYTGSCSTGTKIDSTENTDTLWVDQTNNTYSSYNHVSVSPNTTTNYYVRSEGGECPPSNCIGLTVDVYNLETHLDKFDKICGISTPSFQLSGGDPSGGNYSGNGVVNNIFRPLEAGIGSHTITYTYTLGSCIATDTVSMDIESSPLNLYSSIEKEICSEGGIIIHAHTLNGAGFYNYLWSDGSLENPLTYASPGKYSVLINDGNECYSFMDSIMVDSSFVCIEMINSFTPNSDGINDFWSLDFTNYESIELIIFNKWGNKIIQFTEPIINWDGSNLPSGTYYYIIKLSESSGNIINQTGPITILR